MCALLNTGTYMHTGTYMQTAYTCVCLYKHRPHADSVAVSAVFRRRHANLPAGPKSNASTALHVYARRGKMAQHGSQRRADTKIIAPKSAHTRRAR